jgi:predicted RNase H-like HicB family nuclease
LKRRYAVIVEKGVTGFGVYAPDVPGCIATGETFEEALHQFKEALEFHLEGLVEDGEDIPQPVSTWAWVELDAP